MKTRGIGSATAFAALATAGAAGLWLVLAWRNPTSTYHFAPIVAAALGPYAARTRSGHFDIRAAWPAIVVPAAVVAVVIVVLNGADRLQGPTFWSEDGATLEAALFTVIGIVIGAMTLVRPTGSADS